MKTTTKNTGIKVTTNVKAGGVLFTNHTRAALKVTTGLRGGMSIIYRNHNSTLLSPDATASKAPKSGIKVTTNVKAGGVLFTNHTRAALKVTTGLRGGMSIIYRNHNSTLLSRS